MYIYIWIYIFYIHIHMRDIPGAKEHQAEKSVENKVKIVGSCPHPLAVQNMGSY